MASCSACSLLAPSTRATRDASTAESPPSLLDETIGRAISISEPDAWGVTVELSVRFKKPVPLDGEVRAIGRITENSSRLFSGTGEIVLADGTVAVEASGRYLKMPIERIAEGDFDTQWFADERELPETVDV